MSDDEPRRIEVFFYGLFMDEGLLIEKGASPQNRRIAQLDNFCLLIGERATLVPCAGKKIYGVVYSLTHREVNLLYSEPSVSEYRPEAVPARLTDGSLVPALCFNLVSPPAIGERNPDYAAKLIQLAERIGLPPEYVRSI